LGNRCRRSAVRQPILENPERLVTRWKSHLVLRAESQNVFRCMDVLSRESQSDRPAANSVSGDERTVLTGRSLALVPNRRIGQNGSLCDGSFGQAWEMADLDRWRKPSTLERGWEADLLRFT